MTHDHLAATWPHLPLGFIVMLGCLATGTAIGRDIGEILKVLWMLPTLHGIDRVLRPLGHMVVVVAHRLATGIAGKHVARVGVHHHQLLLDGLADVFGRLYGHALAESCRLIVPLLGGRQ